ncbi:protein of unknown function [Duganella sacchari]|uniref:DUF4214 domain-containing protein n=1 Tax=Duganella sacchari TaxID=551987 RepID=A0A1M7RCU6_9BURK|nr:DUF4214 domain-containing protein [Duganella sacchari]SHN44046.1 protein of unknown function [Duganella sacchari]
MKITLNTVAVALLPLLLASCGGENSSAPSAQRMAMHAPVPAQHDASEYRPLIEQIFLVYSGLPPAVADMERLSQAFQKQGLPVSALEWLTAYPHNDAVKQALDEIFNRQDVQLNFLGNDNTFVNSVYRRVFGRNAEAAGAAYWAGFLKSGQLTRPQLALLLSLCGQNDDALAATNKLAVLHKLYTLLDEGGLILQSSYWGNDERAVQLIDAVDAHTDIASYQDKVRNYVDSLGLIGGAVTAVRRYYGYSNQEDSIAYGAKYLYSERAVPITPSAGTVVFGATPQSVSWTRNLSTDIWNYTAPVSNSVAMIIMAARFHDSPKFVGYAIPDIAMLCQGTADKPASDVLIPSQATPVISAIDLAGIVTGSHFENCTQQGSQQRLEFDGAGNLFLYGADGRTSYTAAQVSAALAGKNLTDPSDGKGLMLRAYRLPKVNTSTMVYVFVTQHAGTLGLWSSEPAE